MDNKDEIARYAKLSIVTLDQSVPPSNVLKLNNLCTFNRSFEHTHTQT